MEIDHSCPEIMVNKEQEEPVLDKNSLLAALVDRMEPIQIFQRRPFTCIQIRTWYNNREYLTFGFSHLKSGWDEDQGANLAIKKAVLMAYVQVRAHERALSRQNAYTSLLKEQNIR